MVNNIYFAGCENYSKLSFLTELYSAKCKRGGPNVLMSDWLKSMSNAFKFAEIPPSFYELKKIITKMGLKYQKIDACRHDCMLFWGEEDEHLDRCRRCQWPRYKVERQGRWSQKRAFKSMIYFPLGPRLQRLYMSSKMAEHMR